MVFEWNPESRRILCSGDDDGGGRGGFLDFLVEVVTAGNGGKSEVVGGRMIMAHRIHQLAGYAWLFFDNDEVGRVARRHSVFALWVQGIGRMSRHRPSYWRRPCERLCVYGGRVERSKRCDGEYTCN